MLTFSRHKLVSIYRKDKPILLVRGILEDDIYGMEMDVSITLPDLEIVSIQGKWTRMENSECPRAVPFLQEAVGFHLLEEGFRQRVQKTVGRKSCRHFANILLECCDAAVDAASVIRVEAEKGGKNNLILKDSLGEENGTVVASGPDRDDIDRGMAKPVKGGLAYGLAIDLHVHTSEASPCSSALLGDLVTEAKRIGLDGICLTDHNYVWDPKTVAELRQRHDFLILRGNEIATDQGDMLVFGFDEDIKEVIRLDELRKKVLKTGGFIIAAHPFRGFLTFGIGQLGLTPEKAMERLLFQHVDAVEVLNSKVSDKENRFSSQVAAGLGLPGTGGSDAHEVEEVGVYATRFSDTITNEEELVAALKGGSYSPVVFRAEIGEKE
jgi:predicted metal-dependent phosphoesterase TrpH